MIKVFNYGIIFFQLLFLNNAESTPSFNELTQTQCSTREVVSSYLPPTFNQGQLGTCFAQQTSALIFHRLKTLNPNLAEVPSPTYLAAIFLQLQEAEFFKDKKDYFLRYVKKISKQKGVKICETVEETINLKACGSTKFRLSAGLTEGGYFDETIKAYNAKDRPVCEFAGFDSTMINSDNQNDIKCFELANEKAPFHSECFWSFVESLRNFALRESVTKGWVPTELNSASLAGSQMSVLEGILRGIVSDDLKLNLLLQNNLIKEKVSLLLIRLRDAQMKWLGTSQIGVTEEDKRKLLRNLIWATSERSAIGFMEGLCQKLPHISSNLDYETYSANSKMDDENYKPSCLNISKTGEDETSITAVTSNDANRILSKIDETLLVYRPIGINFDMGKLSSSLTADGYSSPNGFVAGHDFHALVIKGRYWDSTKKKCVYKVRNSWGTNSDLVVSRKAIIEAAIEIGRLVYE